MAKNTVRTAALMAAGGFLALAAFQVALALGAPLGRAAWGGFYEAQLPMRLRIASGVGVVFLLLAALTVLGRAGLRVVSLPYSILRWGTWVLVGLLFVGAVMNFASSSVWERFGWAPVTLILGVLCLIVARSASISGEAGRSGTSMKARDGS
jgi:hypothetical protein